jgi:hypothetical protein
MSEDGVKKSSNPMVALATGCVAGIIIIIIRLTSFIIILLCIKRWH